MWYVLTCCCASFPAPNALCNFLWQDSWTKSKQHASDSGNFLRKSVNIRSEHNLLRSPRKTRPQSTHDKDFFTICGDSREIDGRLRRRENVVAPTRSLFLELRMGRTMTLFSAPTDEYWWRCVDFPLIPLYFGGRRGVWVRHEDESTALLPEYPHSPHKALACGEGPIPIALLLGKMRGTKVCLLNVGRGVGERTGQGNAKE